MSCDVTLRARIATAVAALRGRPSEAQRVDSFVTAIRATSPDATPTTPLAVVVVAPATTPLPAARLLPATHRTDTVLLPRIVLTAGSPL